MHKRLWPEITKAVARADFTVDVFFEDGKTINFDLRWLQGKYAAAHHLLTVKYHAAFQVLPYALLWNIEEDFWEEIEISGGDIYCGIYSTKSCLS